MTDTPLTDEKTQALCRLLRIDVHCDYGCNGRCLSCPKDLASRAADKIEALERQLAAATARADGLLVTLEQFAKCELNESNCASLEVATQRIRNVARAAIDAAQGSKP